MNAISRRRAPRASRPHGARPALVRPVRSTLVGTVSALGPLGLALGVLATSASAQGEAPLVDAIPDDVFLVTGGFPNAERQFLNDHWTGVWEAFEASGVLDEALALVAAQAPDQERQQFDAVLAQCQSWCDGVDWTGMCESEMVFAERLMEPLRAGTSFSMGPPDMVFLIRQEEDTARSNYAGLAGILRGVVGQIAALSGADLAVEEHVVEGTTFTSFEPLAQIPDAPSFDISVGLRGDTLVLTMGQRIRDEVAGLLAGNSTLKPISAKPRFGEAFRSLPEAEDSFVFFDVQNLRSSLGTTLGSLLDKIEAATGSPQGQGDIIKNARKNPEASRLSRESYAPYQQGDYAEALRLMEAAYEADSTDSVVLYNLACYSALLGKREQAMDWLESAVKGGFYAPEKISEDSDLDSLRGDERFSAILNTARELAEAELTAGEHEPAKSSPEISIAKVVIDRLLDTIGMFDYGATVAHTEGTSMYTESLFALRAGAESNPFYKVVNTPSVEDFAEYLPQEALGFEVSGGFDAVALYDFLHESVAAVGEPGKQALKQWEEQQKAMGLDVRNGILGLLGTGMVSVSFENELGGDEWVFMQRVRQEEVVEQFLSLGLTQAPELLKEGMKQNPMLGMMALTIAPNATLEGFTDVTIGMTQSKIVLGVEDGWLVLSSSADAIRRARATAAGEHPSVRANEDLAAKAIFPEGPAQRVAYKDTSQTGEELAAALRMVQMMGPMSTAQIPDATVRQMMGKVFILLGKLAPVMQRIDFFDSTASATTFDGRLWRTRAVTHYRGAAEHGPQ